MVGLRSLRRRGHLSVYFPSRQIDGGCKGSLLSLGEGRLRRSTGVEACGLWP